MSIVFSWSTGTWWHFHFVLEYKDMVDVTTTGKNYGYFIKQIENIFRISILWQKHSWHHFNQRNTCKHLAMLCVFYEAFSIWNDVIHVSTTAQWYSTNLLIVNIVAWYVIRVLAMMGNAGQLCLALCHATWHSDQNRPFCLALKSIKYVTEKALVPFFFT